LKKVPLTLSETNIFALKLFFNGAARTMARKNSDAALGVILVAVGIIWAFTEGAKYLSKLPGNVWAGVVLLGVGIGVIVALKIAVRDFLDRRAGKSAARKAAAAINEHLPSLVRRRAQLVRSDAYGKPRLENWAKEISYFVDEHIKPRLTPREHWAFIRESQSNIVTAIHMRVEKEAEKNPAFLTFSDDMTPSDFETFCADELRRTGWNARVTLQSRDQGVDVIAEKKGIRVVLQCKLYARPVGNKAVQEAAAARAHEQADFGIVVTNHRYTQDAEQLASTNNILLLHFTDLQNLDTLIRPRPVATGSWYFDDGNGQVGPLGLEELKETLATLSNPREVFVWCKRLSDWTLVKDVPELETATRAKPRWSLGIPFHSKL
jgi:restriction system protein